MKKQERVKLYDNVWFYNGAAYTSGIVRDIKGKGTTRRYHVFTNGSSYWVTRYAILNILGR